VNIDENTEDIKCGQSATVVKIESVGAIKRRIMDMGILKGVSVFVRKVAPLGDPIEITVRGYSCPFARKMQKIIIVE
jgi:ferrous iron transport protein A